MLISLILAADGFKSAKRVASQCFLENYNILQLLYSSR